MRRPGRGFTLLEILVALAIFAVVSITIYGRVGDVVLQTGSLEARTFATWIAQNTLTRLALEEVSGELPATGRRVESVTMAERQWEVVIDIGAAAAPGLLHAEIRVHLLDADHGRDGGSVAVLDGYLGQH